MNKLLDLLVERRRRQAGDDVPALPLSSGASALAEGNAADRSRDGVEISARCP